MVIDSAMADDGRGQYFLERVGMLHILINEINIMGSACKFI